MIKDYGFIAPVIEKKHYILGGSMSLPEVILQQDSQWDAFLPEYEPQFGKDWDSHGCTVWGTENAIEILEKRIFGLSKNYSERFIYNVLRIRPPGTDPHKVADAIYDKGLIDDSLLPMTESFDEFITPDPMTRRLLSAGLVYKKYRAFGHEWVFTGDYNKEDKINRMIKALQYSPLGVSVTAWFLDDDGIYRDNGEANTHWCVCYGYDGEKRAWKIFDSYDHSTKLYSWDSEISFCKRYSLSEVKPTDKKVNGLLSALFDIVKRFFKLR